MGVPAVEIELQAHPLRFMRRVRWLGAIFALVQFWLYEPPAGVTVPFDQLRTGMVFAAGIIAVNIVSLALERRLSAHHRRVLLLAGLVCDAGVVAALIWLFRFDMTSALWGLLVIPVLEAAVAAQMTGALATWAGLTVFYVMRDLVRAHEVSSAVFELPSVTFRMGIVLIVAATAGSLARGLTREAQAQRAAKIESQQRARLLHGLALSSHALLETQTHMQGQGVWDAIVDAAIDVGFDGASMMVVDHDAGEYTVVCGRGLPGGYVGSRRALGSGIAGAVCANAETVTVQDYSAWSEAAPALRSMRFGAAIGVPIRREADVQAVLVAAHREPGEIPKPEREAIELLAVHAGVALNNVTHFAERARYEARLTEMAYIDALTGLANRAILLRRLDQIVSAPSAQPAAVLFVDVDRFKKVNDSLGHHGGDAMLVELSKRLVDAARPHLVTRFGGDEFVILIENVRDVDHAFEVATGVMAALSLPLVVGGQEIVPSVSVGIRCTGPDDTDADALVRDADTAMYRAKQLGRQRVEVFDAAATKAVPTLTLEAEMRRGLGRGEFSLHYQPVVSLADGWIGSVEALLRWTHPIRGAVSPAEFIPVAEDSGFIVELGRWVLIQACRQAARWRADGLALDIAVNVSVVQLQHGGLVDDITAALSDSGLSPANLVLEITESATVTNPELMLAHAQRIRDLGVRLALDDFGQGTTSLRFIRRLPLDILKIDKSLVDELLADGDGDQAAVVRAMIHLAHDLGLTVTGEGVEDEQQVRMLESLGCDHAQGYLLGRPMPGHEVSTVIEAATIVNEIEARQ